MTFQTKGTVWQGEGDRVAHIIFRKAVVVCVAAFNGNLKMCMTLIARQYLLRVRAHVKHFRTVYLILSRTFNR